MKTQTWVEVFDFRLGAVLASMLVLAACATTPENEMLAEAREQVEQAQEMPAVTEHASLTLQQAEQSLAKAESLWEEEGRDETEAVEHHAYLAERRAAAAIQQAARGKAQEEVAQASETREQVMRRAREQELQAARERAEQAEQQIEEQYQAAQQEQALDEQEQTEEQRQQMQELRQTVESLQAQQTERGMVLTMSDVLFDFGESDLNPGGARTMEQLASFLEENPDRQILVEGYTDNIGDAEFNEELARRRAESVREQLVAAGIDRNRIEVQAHGENYPIATNETTAGRQLNRRVEVVVAREGEGTPEPRNSSPAAEAESNGNSPTGQGREAQEEAN